MKDNGYVLNAKSDSHLQPIKLFKKVKAPKTLQILEHELPFLEYLTYGYMLHTIMPSIPVGYLHSQNLLSCIFHIVF